MYLKIAYFLMNLGQAVAWFFIVCLSLAFFRIEPSSLEFIRGLIVYIACLFFLFVVWVRKRFEFIGSILISLIEEEEAP